MYKVVVGIDTNEERALAQAKAIADLPAQKEVHAILLHDFIDNPSGASAPQVAAVRRAKERLETAGIEVSLEESSGDPAAAIIDLAEELDANLICVAGRERSPTGKALFGSVTQSVFLGTERPVLTCSVKDQ